MLTPDQKEMLEQPIELEEVLSSLFSMKKGKVCGCDGLSVEFYATFIEWLKELLFTMYQQVLEQGSFGLSSRKGLISLLPKKGKDSRYIKNLRPLTLLNTDFKVLAKVMANRIKKVLPHIIGPQQTGFMPGRCIYTNIRKTIDIVGHIFQSGKQAVIISIDFEKCFDRIEHESIYGALALFNFGMNFIKWSKVFFNDLLICTQNAGYQSQYFRKTRGVNQGCTYSPFCYVICGEIMARLIQQNPYIEGVKMARYSTEQVITQFADDTSLYLTYTATCINAAIQTLIRMEQNTSLKVSYEKTCIYRIGSLKNSKAEFYTIKPIKWSDGDIEMLGVTVQNQANQNSKGFDSLLNKAKIITTNWQNHNLTLLGKVLVINSLISSLFVYHMRVLPRMSESQIENFYVIIKMYFWGKSRAKILIGVLQNRTHNGGLKLTNILERQHAIQRQWVKIVCENEEFGYVFELLHPHLKEKIFECNIKAEDLKDLNIENQFWKGV